MFVCASRKFLGIFLFWTRNAARPLMIRPFFAIQQGFPLHKAIVWKSLCVRFTDYHKENQLESKLIRYVAFFLNLNNCTNPEEVSAIFVTKVERAPYFT